MAKLWEPNDSDAPTFWVAWCDLSDSFCAPFPHCLQYMRDDGCAFRLVPCEEDEEGVEQKAESSAA